MNLHCDYFLSKNFSNCNAIVFLHGFLGSGANLKPFAKRFTPLGYNVYLPDLRNHGRSPHSDKMGYQILAHDVYELLKGKNLDRVILCGHSMGGKAAIQFTIDYPEKVDRLIVLDMTYEFRDLSEIRYLIKILSQVDLKKVESYEEVKKKILSQLNQPLMVDFVLKNLITFPEFKWRCNMELFSKNIDFLGEEISVSSLPSSIRTKTLFVGGELSGYITEITKKRIQENFKNVIITMIPDAGHWLHYEKPQQLFNILLNFLKNGKKTN